MASLFTKDVLLKQELKNIEKELFSERLPEHQVDQILKKHQASLTPFQKNYIDRYHQALELKSTNRFTQAKKQQLKVMKVLHVQIRARVKLERMRNAIIQERVDYRKEREGIQNKKLQVSMKEFVHDRRQESAVMEYILDREVNDSDDDLNIFDQLAAGVQIDAVKDKLFEDFKQKMEIVKVRMKDKEEQKRLGGYIQANSMEHGLARTRTSAHKS